jgi:DNA-directed RNA polymerase beta' subunit
MGAPNKLRQYSTCHGSVAECPGHFDYLKLALPVFNFGFFNYILDVLKCICKELSLRSLCHGHVACVVILILFHLTRTAAWFLWRKIAESF